MATGISKRKWYKLRQWWFSFLLAALLVSLVALLAIRFFFVTSTSMQNTLYPGDFVFVNKMAYGPRLPRYPFTIPYTGFYIDGIRLPYYRLPGSDRPRRNDIVAFNHPAKDEELPVEKRRVAIGRLAALPGDTLAIRDKTVRVNDRELSEPPGLRYNFHLKMRDNDPIRHLAEHFPLQTGGRLSNRGDWLVSTTNAVADSLEKLRRVVYIREWVDDERTFSSFIYPHDERFRWSLDHYGPLMVPGKGDTISITERTLSLYGPCIEDHEGKLVLATDTGVYINGKERERYGFERDYYFVLGDDRHNAQDSRSWGFLPENHLVGRVRFVLFSFANKGKGSFSWGNPSRSLKGVAHGQ